MTQNKRFLIHILQCTTCMQTKHFIGINPTLNFLDLCFRTAWYSSLVSHREKKNQDKWGIYLISIAVKAMCVFVCACLCVHEELLSQKRESMPGGRGKNLFQMTSSKVLVKRSQLSHSHLFLAIRLQFHLLPPPPFSSGLLLPSALEVNEV